MVNKKLLFRMLVMVLIFGFVVMGCETDLGNAATGDLAGTVWNGRVEIPTPLSYKVSNSTIRWTHEYRYATDLKLENGTFTNGQSLVGTKWSGKFGNAEGREDGFIMTLSFIDDTTAIFDEDALDRITYTLVDDTINFEFMRIREGTLAFKENSGFQFNDRGTEAIGTYNIEEDVITLNGVWQNGDAGAGTEFEVSGSIDSNTIELTGGHFWDIRIFNKEDEAWYPKDN